MKTVFLAASFLATPYLLHAQFDGAAGTEGSLAIHRNDVRFTAWATGCRLLRGWQDIARPELGQISAGAPANALGEAGDGQVVTLGDGGMATLMFGAPIIDGEGVDFVVFENAFSDIFLELALVEVSSDGRDFFRFPAQSLTDTTTQIASFGSVDPTKIRNLAGKYRAPYGTGFDLAELADVAANDARLDLQNIRFVRVIDVVGSLSPEFCTRDSEQRPINDPYPTAFETGGFDLDAVGVFHQAAPLRSIEIAAPAALWHLRSSNQLPAHAAPVLLQAPDADEWQFAWLQSDGKMLATGSLQATCADCETTITPPADVAAGALFLHLRSADGSRQTLTFFVR